MDTIPITLKEINEQLRRISSYFNTDIFYVINNNNLQIEEKDLRALQRSQADINLSISNIESAIDKIRQSSNSIKRDISIRDYFTFSTEQAIPKFKQGKNKKDT